MKKWFALTLTVASATIALLVLFGLMGNAGLGIPGPALARSAERDDAAAPLSLTVTAVDPTVAPNDLDTPIIITGTGFTAELSGTLVITQPTAYLGATALEDVNWVSTTTLTATVPWGLITGTYTLTVSNPGGESSSLVDAFTVTQGIGVWTTDGPYGGYIVGIEKKPGTPTTIYALASNVGLFASEDAGGSWELIYKSEGSTDLVFDAQDPEVMYYGAADGCFVRTANGGDTWEIPSQIPATGDCYLAFPAAHPSSAGAVYVGIGSCEGIPFSPGDGGVFRSDDYGDTWITVTEGMTDTDVQSIAIHPNDPDKMLAGTFDGNLYVSTDGGESWSLSAYLDGPVIAVYFNPYQPLEAWASASTDVHDAPYLYTSTNLADWTPVVIDPGAVGGWPNRWNLTFLTDTIWASSSAAYTSTNGGGSWAEVSGLHHGANVVAVTPENPQEVYVGTQEGVDKSEDGGQTWQQVNEGLAGIVPSTIAVAPTELDAVYVDAGQQGIFRSFNGGHAWQDLGSGGGGGWGNWLVVDAYTPTRVYLGKAECADAFCVEISTDAGETWDLVTATLPVTYAGWKSTAYALVSHPQVSGRILAGSWVWPPGSAPWLEDTLSVVYASDDHGQSWTRVGLTQPISPVMDIAYDAVDPNLVYMATQGTGLWKSTNGGNIWQAMPAPGGRSIVDGIAPHPSISGTLVIATSDDVHGAGLYSSQDAGETWTFLNSDVDEPLVYAPSIPPILYGRGAVPENRGFVRSLDNGQTWEQVTGAPYPTCLAAGTDGERVMLYIGSPGGLPSQAGAQTAWQPDAILGESTIFGGGVYRMTTRLPNHWVYLPLVLRGRAP